MAPMRRNYYPEKKKQPSKSTHYRHNIGGGLIFVWNKIIPKGARHYQKYKVNDVNRRIPNTDYTYSSRSSACGLRSSVRTTRTTCATCALRWSARGRRLRPFERPKAPSDRPGR